MMSATFKERNMSIFMQKHAPQAFSDLVFADDGVEKRLHQYATIKRTNHLILHGGYGTGKSTIARLICEARLCSEQIGWVLLNGAEVAEKEIRVLGNSLRLLHLSEGVLPVGVIDEANLLSSALQYKLRALMDSSDFTIIMTTNYPHEIDPSIRNRCDIVKIDPLSYSPIVGQDLA